MVNGDAIQSATEKFKPPRLPCTALSKAVSIAKMSDSSLNPMNGGHFVHNNVRKVDGGSILQRLSLANKTAIVTGAGAGIGHAIAVAYAEMGCNIAIWYNKNEQAVKKAAALAEQYKIKCKPFEPLSQRLQLTFVRQGVSS